MPNTYTILLPVVCLWVSCVLQEATGYTAAMFSLLTTGRVREAVALASKHRDHRLASLIAQGGWGNPTLMNMCREQLSEWERQNVRDSVQYILYYDTLL